MRTVLVSPEVDEADGDLLLNRTKKKLRNANIIATHDHRGAQRAGKSGRSSMSGREEKQTVDRWML